MTTGPSSTADSPHVPSPGPESASRSPRLQQQRSIVAVATTTMDHRCCSGCGTGAAFRPAGALRQPRNDAQGHRITGHAGLPVRECAGRSAVYRCGTERLPVTRGNGAADPHDVWPSIVVSARRKRQYVGNALPEPSWVYSQPPECNDPNRARSCGHVKSEGGGMTHTVWGSAPGDDRNCSRDAAPHGGSGGLPWRVAVLALVVCLALAACSSSQGVSGQTPANSAASGPRITVDMVTHGQAFDPFWALVQEGRADGRERLQRQPGLQLPDHHQPAGSRPRSSPRPPRSTRRGWW